MLAVTSNAPFAFPCPRFAFQVHIHGCMNKWMTRWLHVQMDVSLNGNAWNGMSMWMRKCMIEWMHDRVRASGYGDLKLQATAYWLSSAFL